MEQVSKLSQETEKTSGKGLFAGSMQALEDLKAEFHKVSWTSKEELITYTKIVVGAIFIAAFAVYGVDLVIQGFLAGLSYLF